MNNSNNFVDAFSAVELGDTGRRLMNVFERIEIAEEEIAVAQKTVRSKRGKKALWESFWSLRPSSLLGGFSDDLYRVHCRELLERIVTGDSVDVPTDAEVMVALSEMSLRAPLSQDAAALYVTLFKKGFPGKLPEVSTRDVHESYAGAMALVDNEIRRKLSKLVSPRIEKE